MTNLDSMLKSRDITLPTKVRLVKAMFFPLVMYGCESWTVRKAEHRRIDAFELWCWRRLMRVPWTVRRSNQSIPKEISPGCSLEGMMLKLKPVLWPPHAKSWLIRKDSDAGRDWGQEEKGTTEDEMAAWHHWWWTWVWVNSGCWWWTGRPGVLWFMGLQSIRPDWVTELNSTEKLTLYFMYNKWCCKPFTWGLIFYLENVCHGLYVLFNLKEWGYFLCFQILKRLPVMHIRFNIYLIVTLVFFHF